MDNQEVLAKKEAAIRKPWPDRFSRDLQATAGFGLHSFHFALDPRLCSLSIIEFDLEADTAGIGFQGPEAAGQQGHEIIPFPFNHRPHRIQAVIQPALIDQGQNPGHVFAEARPLIQRDHGKFHQGHTEIPLEKSSELRVRGSV